MKVVLTESAFFGVMVSLIAYGIGLQVKKKFKIAVFNPLLVSIVLVMVALSVCHVEYDVYYEGAK